MATRTAVTIVGVAAVAAGVCTRAELRAAGLSPTTIDRQIQLGFLVRVATGVYEVPGLVGAETPLHRALKVHRGGALSGPTAARLWGFPLAPAGPSEPVRVTIPAGGCARSPLPDVVVRSTRRWFTDDVVEVRPGLLATTPARTLVDLTGTAIGDRRLRHVIQTQVTGRQVTFAELRACLDRVGARGVAGAGRLRDLFDGLDDGQPVPASLLERRLARLVERGRFRRQYRPPWYDGVRNIVDFADPSSRILIEADGRRWHGTEQAMGDDRRRDRLAVANGWLVLRYTWSDVVDRPDATAAEVASVVERRLAELASAAS